MKTLSLAVYAALAASVCAQESAQSRFREPGIAIPPVYPSALKSTETVMNDSFLVPAPILQVHGERFPAGSTDLFSTASDRAKVVADLRARQSLPYHSEDLAKAAAAAAMRFRVPATNFIGPASVLKSVIEEEQSRRPATTQPASLPGLP